MKKTSLLLLLFCAIFALRSQAQTTAASYCYSGASGTYTAISSGTSLSLTGSTGVTVSSISIGFTFNFCGTNYTTLSVCSNGWVSLANSTSVVSTNTAASIPSAGFLMPCWDALEGLTANSASASYKVTGSAPNRVMTIEWANWNDQYNTASTKKASFEVKLYETSNIIQFCYGTDASFTTGGTTTVGIANSTSDFLTVSSTSDLATSSSTSTTTFATSDYFLPASAYICTFTPKPNITASASPNPVCAGSSLTISGTGASGSSYTWTGPNSFTSTSLTPAAFTSSTLSAGVYTLTASNTCATVTATTSSVVVGAPPAAIGFTTATVCTGSSISFTESVSGGTWSSATPAVATVSATSGSPININGLTAGTSVISYSTPGCTPATKTVTVNTTPVAITGASAVCTGATITLADGTSGGTWSSGSTSVATVTSGGVVRGVSAGSVSISYTKTGCSVTQSVTVNQSPTVTVSPTSSVFCSGGSAVNLTSSGTATSYTWAPAATLDVTTGTSVNASPTATTTYTVTGTLGSCTTNATSVVTYNVSTTPLVAYGSDTICNPGLSPIIEYGTGGTWSSSNTSVFTVSGGIVYAAGAGTATVTYTNATCGTSTLGLTIISGGFTMSTTPSSGTYCNSGSPLSISVTSGSADTFLWEPTYGLSDSVHSTTTASPAVSLIYTVYGTNSTTGCHASATVTVINVSPAAITGATTSMCVGGSTLALSDATGGGSWSSSNTSVASVSSSGVVTAISTGTATISYTVSGCPALYTVNVGAPPTAISPSSASACVGANATFTNTTSGGVWSTSSTSLATINSSTGVATGVGTGVVTISYTTAGCSPVTATLNVQALPAGISGTGTICAGTTSTLTDSTSGGTWTSSTTSVATVNSSGVVTGVTSGSATITYTQGGCYVTYPFTVSTTPATISGPSSVCAPITYTLLSEDWENGVPTAAGTAVDGWNYLRGTGAADNYWLQTSTGSSPTCSPESGSSMAEFNSFSITSGNTAVLCSPAFDLTGLVNGTVTFWVYRDHTAYTGAAYAVEAISIAINTSPSTSGATLLGTVPRPSNQAISGSYLSGTSSTTVSGWYQYTATIPSSFSGSGNYLLFVGKSHYGDNQFLDNIVCTATQYGTSTLTDAVSGGTWSSSNTSVASVSGGVVTGEALGTATISYSIGSCVATAPVSSLGVPGPITGSSIVLVSSTTTLADTTTGGSWSSSATSIASVNSSTGVVTGVSTGTDTIAYSTGCGSAAYFTISSTNPCSGTPAAGSASISPTYGGSTTVFTATATGYTIAGSITFQWQSSPDNATWSNLSGATNNTYTFTGISANTYYRCKVTCGISSITSNGASCEATYVAPSSCTPAFLYGTGYGYGCSDHMIVCTTGYPFSINGASGSINDVTNCNAAGYIDETATGITCTLNAGTTYVATLGANNIGSYSLSDQIWIDFNNNGIFESTESVGGGAFSSTTTTTSLVIPSGSSAVTAGTYRMRVEVVYTGAPTTTYPSIPPCPTTSTEDYGDVRDYAITIAVPAVYSLAPASISFAPTVPGSTSATTTSTLTASYLVPATGSLTVTAPTGFNISSNGTTWVTSYTITYTGSTVSAATIYAQFAPSATTTYSGNISVTGGTLTGANIAVTGTGAAACTGTPTAGTASVSPTSGASSTPFTLSVTGYTVAGGITFQWQSSADGTTWSNISGATLPSYYFTGISANTYYRCNVTCSGSTSATASVLATWNLPASSCTPTFSSASFACTDGMYMQMALNGAAGSINDVTACSGTGYEDLSSTYSCYLLRGTTYTATISTGSTYATSENCQVWIDFNDNGSFESSESVGGISSFTSAAQSISLVIPSGAATGSHRMRIVGNYSCCGYGTYPGMNPCPTTSITYGDARDYKVTIVAPSTCSGTPAAGAVTATSISGCSPVATTLNPTAAVGVTGLTYQWQSSTTGSSFTSISGATNFGYSPSVTSNTYYNVVLTCTTSGGSATSASQLITAYAAPTAITGATSECNGATTTFTDGTSGGTWSSSNTSVASVNASTGVVTGVSVGTAIISYTTASCAPATAGITILGTPASITGTTSVCAGSSSTLANSVSGGTWSSSDTTIATVTSGTGVVTGVAAGTATITYSTGCGSAATTSFTVNTTPSAIIGLSTICTAATYTFVDTVTGGTWTNTPTTMGTIDPGSGVFSSTTTTGATVVTYTLGTCSVTFNLTVGNSSPGPITGTASACVGATSTLSDTSVGGVWSSSNTAIATVVATTGVITGTGNGTATITYSTGCGTPSTTTWTSNGTAVAITYSSGGLTGPVCSGGTLSLNSGTLSGGTYSWSGPNSFSSTAQNPTISSVTTAATGVYTFSATVAGCTTPNTTAFIAVDASPTVTVTPSPATICSGSTSTLSAAVSAPASGSYVVNAIPYNLVTLTSPTSIPNASWTGGNDDGYLTVSLPFTFYFYGTGYSSINIGTNGFVNFGSATSTNGVFSYPSSSGPSAAIALFEADLVCPTNSVKYATMGSAPNRQFIIYYSGEHQYSGGAANVNIGQVILYESTNVVDVMVKSTYTTAKTCGIQNAAGTSAVTAPGRNDVAYTVSTSEGWRFEQPNYSYSWSPATTLSSSTGSSVTSSGLTSTQIFTVTTIDANSGCSAGSNTTATITVNPLPTAYSVTGGGAYCSVPGTGAHIGLSGSQTGVNYQLYKGATVSGTSVSGTGSALDFGLITDTSGIYTVVATDATTGCTATMTGSSTLSIAPNPTAYTITGGSGCTTSGVTIGLSNSQTGVSYQLYNGSTGGAILSGTGSALSYGIYTVTGTYGIVGTSAAGCSTNMTGSSTIATSPASYSVTGGNGCSGSGVDVGLFGSQSGVSYQLYNGTSIVGAAVTGTGSALDFGTQTTAGRYSVVGTLTGGCTTTMAGADTVNASPDVSVGANPSVCLPATTATLSYTSATGSPTTYSIIWSSGALTAGFTNVSGATLSGGTLTLSLPTGVTGTYVGSLTVSNGTCSSSAYSFSVTVLASPTAAITSAVPPCVGSTTSVVFTGTSGISITYSVDGGSPATATLTGGTFSLTTTAMTSSHTYELLTAYNGVCTTTIDSTDTLSPLPMQWMGGTSGHETDWNTASNWSCGFVPTSAYDVSIPTGTAFIPEIGASASGSARKLTIASGASVIIDAAAVLNVTGNLFNNGSVNGVGTLSMNGTTTQHITGIGSVANFDLNNGDTAIVDSGNLMTVKNTLSVSSGVLNTMDSVVLNSDSLLTARVASLPSTGSLIVGNVKVMQYITGGRRAYRFWAHPFSTYIPLAQIENYIDITGYGGALNGFTPTGTGSPSAYRYDPTHGNSANPSDPGWIAFTSCYATPDSNKFKPFQGIRLFYRGSKGEGLTLTSGYTIDPATVGMWGNLNQGNVNVTITKGTGLNQDYNMVGNPYASPVDIGTVVYNAKAAGRIAGTVFYVWNPFLGSAGQFQSIPIGVSSPAPYYLQAQNSFQVRALNPSVVLNFTESNKSATATADLLKAIPEFVSLVVYDAAYHPWDMTYIKFNDAASAADENDFDGTKPMNGATDFNFYSISSDNHKLSLDARPYKAGNVIPLGLTSSYAQEYIIKAEGMAVPEGGKVYLHDKLLKQYVLLQQGTEYKFSVTADKATQGEERFELSMEPREVATVAATKGLNVTMTPNPATDEVKVNFTNGKTENVSVRVLDLSGVSIYNQKLGNLQSGSVSIPLGSFASGIYMVELTSGDQKVTERLIKE